jgi:hypothetical protein
MSHPEGTRIGETMYQVEVTEDERDALAYVERYFGCIADDGVSVILNQAVRTAAVVNAILERLRPVGSEGRSE